MHGCFSELVALLGALGYDRRDGTWEHPDGRVAVFAGDLMDRGPSSLDCLELVWRMNRRGCGLLDALGNHDYKAYRALVMGRDVEYDHGFWATVQDIEAAERRDPQARERITATVAELFGAAPSYSVFDGGRLVVTHAALRRGDVGKPTDLGRGDDLSDFCMFGEREGEPNDRGVPARSYNWATTWTDDAVCVYGHDVAGGEPIRRGPNGTVIGIDTGCCYGGALTALRWPEMETVAVGALREHAERRGERLGGRPLYLTRGELTDREAGAEAPSPRT